MLIARYYVNTFFTLKFVINISFLLHICLLFLSEFSSYSWFHSILVSLGTFMKMIAEFLILIPSLCDVLLWIEMYFPRKFQNFVLSVMFIVLLFIVNSYCL